MGLIMEMYTVLGAWCCSLSTDCSLKVTVEKLESIFKTTGHRISRLIDGKVVRHLKTLIKQLRSNILPTPQILDIS